MWDKINRFLFASVHEVVTWVWIGLSIGAYFYNAGNKNARGVRLAEISLALSVFAMLCFIAKRVFWDAESDKPRRRPELYTSGAMMLPLEPGKPEIVLIGLKNRGNATARNIRLGGGNHLFTDKSFSGPLQYELVPVQVREDLGSGDEEKTLQSQSPKPISKSEIRKLRDGEILFFHFAEGEYDDDSGNTYPIDYCYMYNRLAPNIMNICPERYWPKDRIDRRFPPRPRLVFTSAGVNLIAGEHVDVHVVITNEGPGEITRLRCEGVTTVKPKSFKGPLDRKGTTRGEMSVTPMAVGAPITTTLREPQRWTKNEIAAIKNGDRLLFHFGRIEYTDALGNLNWIEYCMRYETGMPLSSSGMHYLSFADRSFWPKDEEDKQGEN
jgi:hypothetical protein